ncbi:hypothetical protein QYF61_011922 [Mycteria americana]|uniref:Reverse transcriptase domain-containing protein n=1 Tax=Mycteria americana TaxID=33587 RepID=A0AAN7NUM0_MYCAM|nr:hypothetical protein QYF61_011922 [Mycteria americana]
MTVNWSSCRRAETALTPRLKMGWEVSVFGFLHFLFLKISHSGEFDMLRSCLAIVIAFYNKMSGLVDEECAVNVVYANFNKAFNTISHNILTDKLMKHG